MTLGTVFWYFNPRPESLPIQFQHCYVTRDSSIQECVIATATLKDVQQAHQDHLATLVNEETKDMLEKKVEEEPVEYL